MILRVVAGTVLAPAAVAALFGLAKEYVAANRSWPALDRARVRQITLRVALLHMITVTCGLAALIMFFSHGVRVTDFVFTLLIGAVMSLILTAGFWLGVWSGQIQTRAMKKIIRWQLRRRASQAQCDEDRE